MHHSFNCSFLSCVELGPREHILTLTKNDINKVELIVLNAYAPNGNGDEKVNFFEDLCEKLADAHLTYNCQRTVLAGDLNLVFYDYEVKNRAYCRQEQQMASLVRLIFEDCWDKTDQNCFTWSTSRIGTQAFSVLDRVLISKDHFVLDKVRSDWGICISDHAAVIATFKSSIERAHKISMISRLDSRLLLDEEGVQKLNETFNELYDQRMLNWDPHVSLEYCKMCIRTAANSATGMINKYRDEELALNNDIN